MLKASGYAAGYGSMSPFSRILLVALLLYDPMAKTVIGLQEASTAINTYLEELGLPGKSTEEVAEAMQQLVVYALLVEGDNSFGRIPNPYEVSSDIFRYFIGFFYIRLKLIFL